MSNERSLQKAQHCVLLKNGIELWIDNEKLTALDEALQNSDTQFISINGQRINRYQIDGVFDPLHIEELIRRKNGEYRCVAGHWHGKGKECRHSVNDREETVVAYVPELDKTITYIRTK